MSSEASQVDSLQARVAMTHRTAAIIVLALTTSVVLSVVAGLLILDRVAARGARTDLRLPLYGIAAAFALGSIALRRVLLLRFRLESIAERRGGAGVLRHLFTVTLVSAALAEAVGSIALIMAFFGGDQIDLVRLGIVALVVSLYNYPRLGTWRQAVEYFSATQPRAVEPN
jgi:hypothetical protein